MYRIQLEASEYEQMWEKFYATLKFCWEFSIGAHLGERLHDYSFIAFFLSYCNDTIRVTKFDFYYLRFNLWI